LESLLYAFLTDSKLLFYGNNYPFPWSIIEDDFSWYLYPFRKKISRISSKFYDSSRSDISTESTLYRELRYHLNSNGKLLDFHCDKFKFTSQNTLLAYTNNNANPVKIEFDILTFINFNSVEDELQFLFEKAELSNIYNIYDIFEYKHVDSHVCSANDYFKIFKTGIEFPSELSYYHFNKGFFLMCKSEVTAEDIKKSTIPDINEIYTRKILFDNPKTFLQKNMPRSFRAIKEFKHRHILDNHNITYNSIESIEFLELNKKELLEDLKLTLKERSKVLCHVW